MSMGSTVSDSLDSSTASRPLRPRERIQELDVIRGFALFGILLVNMTLFKSVVDYFFIKTPVDMPNFADQLGMWFIQLFATGKFYAIFSFLFGLGFYIFLERLMAKGWSPTTLYRRRLLGLLIFGLVHLVFIWSGDILFYYSVVGFFLMAFRRASPETLVPWIIFLFILAVLIEGGFSLIISAAQVILGEEFTAEQTAMMEEATAVFRDGSFVEILRYRWTWEVWPALLMLVYYVPAVLAYFLCGLYAGKMGVFKNVEAHLPSLKRVWRWGLGGGAVFTGLYILMGAEIIPVADLWRLPLLSMINQAGAVFLSAFYVTSLLLLLQKAFWKRVLTVFSAPGRMALTNYLSQSILCVLIFYGYGGGYFNQVSVVGGIGLTFGIVFLQVLWSNWWMARFNYGPLEWLWRYFTYRQKPEWKSSYL